MPYSGGTMPPKFYVTLQRRKPCIRSSTGNALVPLVAVMLSMQPTEVWTQDGTSENWPVYTMPWDIIPDGALNLSRYLDAPAGKHGFMRSEDGKLVFEDGVRARFWGVNLVAAAPFPTGAQAQVIAERLARAGCNLVRLHHMDAPWHNRPIIDYGRQDSQHLDPEQLARLDRLIYELKLRGIYIHLDLLVHRKFMPGDNLPDVESLANGQKHVSYTNRRLIELQKQYAHDILTHVNTITGLRYADDPAIAVVMLVNENSIFWTTGDPIPKVYLDEIDALWNRWLLEQYGSREGLSAAWTSATGSRALSIREDPTLGTVRRPHIGTWGEKYFAGYSYAALDGPPRVADHFRFLAEIQQSFYDEMTDYLRDELGVRCAIAGTNLSNGVVGLRGDVRQGIVETDVYYNHPRDGYGIPNEFPNAHISNSAPYAQDREWGTDAFHVVFARSLCAQAPLLVTEWNQPHPTPYRAESMPFVAADSSRRKSLPIATEKDSLRWSLPNPDETGAIHFELILEETAADPWLQHSTD